LYCSHFRRISSNCPGEPGSGLVCPDGPGVSPFATSGTGGEGGAGVGAGAEGAPKVYRAAVLDFGIKRSILDQLNLQGLDLTVWPGDTPAETITEQRPQGIFLANGPGDPAACSYAVRTARHFLGRIPVFGICLGHQIMGLAAGGRTYKLPFGHHGLNHPVLDTDTGRVSITSQNHGFCVDPESLPAGVRPSMRNLNDGTVEGLVWDGVPAFCVQFHPEASPGPHDSRGLFARFRRMIEDHDAQA
jgi:carbamoyl-phosphate synthase small subunit